LNNYYLFIYLTKKLINYSIYWFQKYKLINTNLKISIIRHINLQNKYLFVFYNYVFVRGIFIIRSKVFFYKFNIIT